MSMNMAIESSRTAPSNRLMSALSLGALTVICIVALIFFWDGVEALLDAWATPEYSHGPLIPALSALLFLRELRRVPVKTGSVPDRWPGVVVVLSALALGFLGKIIGIGDIVAYALIVFIGGIVLTSFGWKRGVAFWPAVLHLAFMLPLPGTIYWKISTNLQLFSSEVGVLLIRAFDIPVFLDGNIIDLGIYKLHVAEACSGLRYLYPILSFSYIFAALYKGPIWHKAVLLLAAAPITVMMNSIRIGIIGIVVNSYGLAHVEGITHLLEGWVIFLASVIMLFGLVKVMLLTTGQGTSLSESLDIDFADLRPQAARIFNLRLSAGFVAALASVVILTAGWSVLPEREAATIERRPLVAFPSRVGDWRQVRTEGLEPAIVEALGADDYLSATYASADAAADVDFFVAWYADQSQGGIHSPEVCLPGGGWEMAEIERVDISPRLGLSVPVEVNRAIIQRGEVRLLVYYWFEQYGGRTASDIAAKFALLKYGLLYNRTDGALVRIITPLLPGEPVERADARLLDFTASSATDFANFIPMRTPLAL